jgi:hypothetical protein
VQVIQWWWTGKMDGIFERTKREKEKRERKKAQGLISPPLPLCSALLAALIDCYIHSQLLFPLFGLGFGPFSSGLTLLILSSLLLFHHFRLYIFFSKFGEYLCNAGVGGINSKKNKKERRMGAQHVYPSNVRMVTKLKLQPPFCLY